MHQPVSTAADGAGLDLVGSVNLLLSLLVKHQFPAVTTFGNRQLG